MDAFIVDGSDSDTFANSNSDSNGYSNRDADSDAHSDAHSDANAPGRSVNFCDINVLGI